MLRKAQALVHRLQGMPECHGLGFTALAVQAWPSAHPGCLFEVGDGGLAAIVMASASGSRELVFTAYEHNAVGEALC